MDDSPVFFLIDGQRGDILLKVLTFSIRINGNFLFVGLLWILIRSSTEGKTYGTFSRFDSCPGRRLCGL